MHPPWEAPELWVMMQGRGLLALWMTNRERHRRFVDAELLPAWGLRQVAAWYWLKVTDEGQLVSSLVCTASCCLPIVVSVCQLPQRCAKRVRCMLPRTWLAFNVKSERHAAHTILQGTSVWYDAM